MKIDLKFAELHNPLFLGGKNLGLKLDHKKHPSISLVYDRAEKELLVTWNGETGIIPASNVSSMTPALINLSPPVVKTELPPRRLPGEPFTAQVETPQSHVHAGPGHGSTGQEPPKKGGRPPKGSVVL